MTIKEIEQLPGVYLDRPQEPIGPRVTALLERAEGRIEERMRELDEVRERIRAFRAERPDVLAGEAERELTAVGSREDRCGAAESAGRAAAPRPRPA